ncbi:exonuclease SbcCD subunit D [Clostridium thermobutyricum]|uniref:exonuclease SbcCD subunit D n=1 Tax=Clostridium thermobutyricum TaxID=29372 RepID=UPI003F51F3B1
MKIFHTGDWHIGKLVNGFYMTEDQRYILSQLCDEIEKENPDVLLIAGDVYDRSIPPVEAIELLNETLKKIIIDLKTPVILIAGNHDSNERIEFGSSLYEACNFYVSGELKSEIKKINLKDKDGIVNFYLIPYADPYYVRKLYNEESIKTHDDALKKILENIDLNKDERNVAIFHGYVAKDSEKIIESDSEKRLSIGGTEVIKSSHFKDFNYTALGHIHSPQRVDGENIRYSGSLMKYSFSEMNNKVGITKIELNGDGDVTVTRIPFKLMRDYREIRGELSELISKEFIQTQKIDDYIKVTLTDKGEVIEPMQKLREVYPNIMELRNESRLKELNMEEESIAQLKEKSILELTCDFFSSIREDEITDEELALVKSVLEEVEREDK